MLSEFWVKTLIQNIKIKKKKLLLPTHFLRDKKTTNSTDNQDINIKKEITKKHNINKR